MLCLQHEKPPVSENGIEGRQQHHKGMEAIGVQKRAVRDIPEKGMLLTAEDIRTNVGRAAPLVLQQVIFTHQMLPKTEVGDRNSVGPEAKTELKWKWREFRGVQ